MRRIGAEDSQTRAHLLDVTERLMLDEGYAAVTSRRVAALAGVKPPLVHYYFRTMDDLFLAVFRRGAEANLERQADALRSPRPLHALWELNRDPVGTALMVEFMALANHRKQIRDEIAAYAARFRTAQVEAMDRGGTAPLSPLEISVLMASISRVLAMEERMGVRLGHDEALALVERYMEMVEGDGPDPA